MKKRVLSLVLASLFTFSSIGVDVKASDVELSDTLSDCGDECEIEAPEQENEQETASDDLENITDNDDDEAVKEVEDEQSESTLETESDGSSEEAVKDDVVEQEKADDNKSESSDGNAEFGKEDSDDDSESGKESDSDTSSEGQKTISDETEEADKKESSDSKETGKDSEKESEDNDSEDEENSSSNKKQKESGKDSDDEKILNEGDEDPGESDEELDDMEKDDEDEKAVDDKSSDKKKSDTKDKKTDSTKEDNNENTDTKKSDTKKKDTNKKDTKESDIRKSDKTNSDTRKQEKKTREPEEFSGVIESGEYEVTLFAEKGNIPAGTTASLNLLENISKLTPSEVVEKALDESMTVVMAEAFEVSFATDYASDVTDGIGNEDVTEGDTTEAKETKNADEKVSEDENPGQVNSEQDITEDVSEKTGDDEFQKVDVVSDESDETDDSTEFFEDQEDDRKANSLSGGEDSEIVDTQDEDNANPDSQNEENSENDPEEYNDEIDPSDHADYNGSISVKVRLSKDFADKVEETLASSEEAKLSAYVLDENGDATIVESSYEEGNISFDLKAAKKEVFIIALTDIYGEPFEYTAKISGYAISLSAEPLVLPKNVKTDIKLITKTEDGKDIEEVVQKEIDEDKEILEIVTFDITFTSNGKVVEPEQGKVNVSIKLDKSMEKAVEEAEEYLEETTLEVYHIDDNSKAQHVESEVTDDKLVVFDAEEFSSYTVVLYANQVNAGTIKSVFSCDLTYSTKPNNKPLVLIFWKTGCGNCNRILSSISGTTLSTEQDVIAAEMSGKSASDVVDYLNDGEYVSDIVDYGYDASSICWSYYRQLGGGNSMTTPLIVYVHKNGDIQGFTNGYVNIFNEIKTRLGTDAKAKEYTVEYMNDEKTVASRVSYAIGHMCCIDFHTNYLDGYEFISWNTKPDGSGTTYKEGDVVDSLTTKANATIKLYAQWKTNNYKITYNLNGGTNNSGNPKTYNAGTPTITLAKPTKKGYSFAGWFSDKNFKNKVTQIPKGSTGNKVFYAKWTANKYTVEFVGNGSTSGSVAKLTGCKYGSSYTLTSNAFKKKGYKFNGWNTKADGSGKAYANGASVKNLSAKNGATVKLYAQWKKAKYTITYELAGGTNNSANPASYTITSNTIKLQKPTRKGYSFGGWFKDNKYSEKVTEIAKGSTGNKTFYAKWTANKYTIAFNGNGSSSGSMKKISSCKYGSSITLTANAFSKKGYTFSGWNTKADGSGKTYANKAKVKNLSAKNGATVTLYAQWSKNSYTVKFNGNGSSSGSMSNQKCKYNTSYNLTANAFAKKGYRFSSWNTKADGSGTSYANKAQIKNLSAKNGAVITLYAQWKINSYNIAFNGNGASSGSIDTVKSVKYGKTVTLPANAFSKKGYKFKEWNTKADGSGTSYANKAQVKNLSTKNGATVTLYARWTAISYKVQFNGNGSTSGQMAVMTCKYGKSYTLAANAFSKTGYEFTGWNTKANGSGNSYDDASSIKNLASSSGKTVTLYAQWEENDGLNKISLGVTARTQAEIRSFIANHPADDTMSYGTSPSLSGTYSEGSLSSKAQKGALNVLNTYRYIAGLSSDVTIKSDYSKLCQKIALVNYLNDSLSHNPSRPSVLSDSKYDSLYEDACEGGTHSNLSYRWPATGLESSLYGQMEDSGTNNLSTVGHRRWILYPNMSQTGFGRVENFSAVYAMDGFRGATGVSVAWPAQNTPADYISNDAPWSLCMGRYVDTSNLYLTVVRKSDGKTWNFNPDTQDGYFAVSNEYYGDMGCIIFRPTAVTTNAGDTYTVTARFLDKNQKLTYKVNFFNLTTNK
ncbi:InlB B-repeat-containing protein [Butyrivibrio sp. YAB3001]|uniref:InlB B-repeat-containing protein n=1 Tax=Butyrivibrio sp. YAB3001 TaxID=1520812 RepID=UPI0008F6630A|nr:InlB B-repeat-containing protein [Butyrivibrio sp. YAB3001]SFB73880.1 Listeria/Bacterioides repeat-containing protein [Butyrivibrio sp. YAB3001]